MQAVKAAGRRVDPPVCVASANGTCLAATAAAEPLLEPPGVWAADQGFTVSGGSAYANCAVAVLPNTTAPARFRLSTTAESVWACRFANGENPALVGNPSTSITSLTPKGTPCSFP